MSHKSSVLDQVERKICSLKTASERVDQWRKSGEARIVYTNGVFDLLHLGHLIYLAQAADLGTQLIVGINTDESVQRLKGPKRPIFDQKTRNLKMACLSYIDLVVPFGEDTPLDCIKELLPDILVKGGDYLPDDIVGAKEVRANGGQVLTIPLEKGLSSTSVIDKIKNLK